MTRENEDEDPLEAKPVGETVTVTDTRKVYADASEVFYGHDRFSDYSIENIEVVENEYGDEHLEVTWEGEVTKTLPENWDYCREPLTETEEREERRNKWIRRGGRALSFVAPLVFISWLSVQIMNKVAGSLTINGETATAAGMPTVVGVVLLVSIVGLVVHYGFERGGFPGMRGGLH